MRYYHAYIRYGGKPLVCSEYAQYKNIIELLKFISMKNKIKNIIIKVFNMFSNKQFVIICSTGGSGSSFVANIFSNNKWIYKNKDEVLSDLIDGKYFIMDTHYENVCNKIKGENIFIPEIIRSNTSLRNDCIRGITDTDGSLFLANKGYRNDYPTIEISTTSKKLAIQIKTILSKNFRIGFRKFKAQNYRMIYRISINGDKMVQKWVKLIGFSNTRNIKRYKKLKNGATGI